MTSSITSKNTPKTPQNQEVLRSWWCTQHHLLKVPTGGQLLVYLHCTKAGLGARRYDNGSTLFLWCQGSSEKCLFQIAPFSLLENRLVSAALSQGAASETTTFLKAAWKLSFNVWTFHFSVISSSQGKLDLKICKIFSRKHLFPVFRVQKNDPMTLAPWYIVDSVNANMRANS